MPMLKLIMIIINIIYNILGVAITMSTGSYNCFACVLIMLSITLVDSADNSRPQTNESNNDTLESDNKNPLLTTFIANDTAVNNKSLIDDISNGNANITLSYERDDYTADINTTVTTAIYISPRTKQDVDPLEAIVDEIEYIQNFYISPPICTAGIVGNSLVAAVLFKRRHTNSSFVYMLALIIADTLSLFADLCIPLSSIFDLFESDFCHEFAANMRYWNEYVVASYCRCLAFNILCVLSIERLIAIKYPLHLKSSLTVRYPRVFLFVSFLLAFLPNTSRTHNVIISPVKVGNSNITVYKPVFSTLYKTNKPDLDKVIVAFKFFGGPLQIVFFCVVNALIIHGMYKSRKQLKTMQMSNTNRESNVRNLQVKLCKMFLVLSIFNILAFLPNAFTVIVARLFPGLGIRFQSPSSKLYGNSGHFIRIANSASDFIVMLAMSSEILAGFKGNCACLRRAETPYVKDIDTQNTLSSSIQTID